MSPPVSPPSEPEKAAEFVSVQHQFERDERRPASSSAGSETAHSEDRRNSVNTLDANQKNRRSWPYAAIFPLPPSQQWRFQQSQCVSSASNHERKESESAAPTPAPAAELRPWDDEGARRRRTYQGDDDDWYTEGEENYRQLTSVANVDFEDAMLSQKPKPWTSAMWKLYFFLLVACLNSCINGYDGSIMSGINAMDSYQKYFNMNTIGPKTGLVFSMYTVGNMVGSFFCGPFTDRWGRRWGMFIGAAIIIFGTLVQAPASNAAMFIGGRFILGFGVATCATAGPSYVCEMAHPAWRGTLTGLYNTFWFVGGIPAAWTVYASRNIPNDLSWRLPIWLQCVASGLVLIGSLFCPETPRWLISNDRHHEALQVLATYHGEGDPRSPLVLLTIREMLEEIATEGADKRWWDYRPLFNSRSALWRQVCVTGMAFLSQWCGMGAVSYFLPPLLDIIGVTDEGTQLQYNGFLNVIQFVMATLGARFTDRLGRRPVLLWSTSLLIFWWIAITVLTGIYQKYLIECNSIPLEQMSEISRSICTTRGNPDYKTPPWSGAIIAVIYIFGITYSFAYTPLQALYPVECLAYENRAKGMGFYNLMVNIAMFFNTFAIPTILEKIGYKLFFMYVGGNTLAVAVIYFFFVETKGRTLEEINDIFDAPYPMKRSIKKHIVVVTRDRVVLGKDSDEYS